MRITPTQTSFAPGGPPLSFRIETGGLRYYSVQVATDAFLLNGSAAARRTPTTFFDSWHGDDLWPATGRRPFRREVPGQHLEAPTDRATYVLPQVAWGRLRGATQLFYRLLVSADEHRRRLLASIEDVNWRLAPSVSVARLPAQPARHPTAAFRGRNDFDRADFLDQAVRQLQGRCIIQGRDGDFRYANRRPEVETVGSVPVRYKDEFDALAIEELKGLSVNPTPANFLQYDDGVAP